jgi:glycosyltransferase involved in cell wall biosynthesis
MHIGMIYGENRKFPPDIRVEKETKALAAAGHRITILARRVPPEAPSEEDLIPNCLKLLRVPVSEAGLLSKAWCAISLRERVWLPHLKKFIEENQPEVLHVHDFQLVPSVLSLAKQFNLPVVADLHENWPAALKAWRSAYPPIRRFAHSLFFNYFLWRWHEARKLRSCYKVIVVVSEAKERLSARGLDNNRILVVSNTEDETTFRFNPQDADRTIVNNYKRYWMASYIGGIAPHRGLDTLLHAIPYACTQIPKLMLTIVGAQKKDQILINQLVRKLSIQEHVDIINWQPFDKVYSYIIASRVGLIPHNNFEHTQTTIPHKLFQYMLSARPVLVSSCRPLQRVVKETRSGRIFEANNYKDLARQLIQMYKNPEETQQLGLNGQKAALSQYAWRNDAQRLIEMYSELDGMHY